MDKEFWAGLLKRWPLLGSFVAGAAACHFYYKEFRIDQIACKNDAEKQLLVARLETSETKAHGLDEKLLKQEDYERKYITESSRAQTLERKFNDLVVDNEALSRRYSDLVLQKWEEKYNTEKLSRLSLQEEASLLKKHLEDAESATQSANPELLKQLSLLQDQLSILSNERDELRKLYVTGSSDGTNGTVKVIRLIDYEKKRILVESRRTDALDRVRVLRGQLLETASTYTQMEILRLQTQKYSSEEQALKCLQPLMVTMMKSVGLIFGKYNGWVFEIYRENEAILAKGLCSSFEDFQTAIGKKSPTLTDAESLVTSIAGIDKTKGNLLQSIVDMIDPHMQPIGAPK